MKAGFAYLYIKILNARHLKEEKRMNCRKLWKKQKCSCMLDPRRTLKGIKSIRAHTMYLCK